ncbi:transcription factor IIIB 50 kDa subunit-like [Saccostrea echinata]|uniref:transcription factor IIIB 50 kDa subunit-like n=1 Tax=Saccostrea echinata TaxID=191078 RepID=UPI002A7EB8EC|nr:transcription factor IIIB 50 kDa subunit-like [Saccostrea echinata]
MATKCGFCGENAVVSESDGSSVSMRVCQECGSIDQENFIVEETSFTRQCDNTSAHEFKQSLSRTARNALSITTPQGLKSGKNRIRVIGQTFKMGAPVIDEALNLYERLFKHPDIINKTISNKLLLAAACMYIMMRQNNIPVSIRWFCKVSDISVNDFSSNFLLVLKAMEITLMHPSIGSRIADVLAPAKLSSKTVNLTREVIQLCEKVWIVSGRSHSPIIVAASHIAWYSLSEHMGRKSSLRDYCRDFGFSFSGSIADRSKEIHDTIFELGKILPWVTRHYKDKKLFIRKYLPEIIKYRESLLHKHKIEVKEKCVEVINVKSEKNPSEIVEGKVEESSKASNIENETKHNHTSQTSSKETNSCDFELKNVEIKKNQQSPSQNDGKNVSIEWDNKCTKNSGTFAAVHEVVYESDSNLRKNLFIPPILKKPRKRIYYEAMGDCEGLDSDDELTELQEKDVDKYIRSNDEINMIRQVKLYKPDQEEAKVELGPTGK